jgi:hypothetical protein
MPILLNSLFKETRVIVLYIGMTSTSIALLKFLVQIRGSEFPAHNRYNDLNIESGMTLDRAIVAKNT